MKHLFFLTVAFVLLGAGCPLTTKEKPAPPALATVEIYPGTMGWLEVAIGVTSPSKQTSTITNTGSEPFVISKIEGVGDESFSYASDCPAVGSSLASGKSCTVTVTFAPTKVGDLGRIFSFYGNVKDGRVILWAQGKGSNPNGLNFAPGSLVFTGATAVGRTSASQTITITNAASDAIALTRIGTTGDFTQTNTCLATIASKGTCTVTVSFKPTAVGIREGTLDVTDSGIGSPHAIPLKGDGAEGAAPLVPSSGVLEFLDQAVGGAATKTWAFKNTGGAALSIKSILPSFPSDFTLKHDCGSTLAIDATCTLSVTFLPTVVGDQSGSVAIAHDATGLKSVLIVRGNGVKRTLTTAPSSLTFASQEVGTPSGAQKVTLSNSTLLNIPVSSITTSGDFALSGTDCRGTYGLGSKCDQSVTFTPTGTGERTGSLILTIEGLSSPQTIPLTGTGVKTLGAPKITSFTPTSGPAGTNVTVTGMNFTETASVSFNGYLSSLVTYVSETQMRAIVPDGATTGAIRVVTTAGAAVSAVTFKVTVPSPVCGNGTCETGETELSCSADCTPAPICGNNMCETGEDSSICPADCTSPEPEPEPEPGTIGFQANSYSVDEAGGYAVVTVVRTDGDDGAVSIDFATADASASDGFDYSSYFATLTFADGETSQTMYLTIIDDAEYEGDEEFAIYLASPTGGAILGTNAADIIIIDNEEGQF